MKYFKRNWDLIFAPILILFFILSFIILIILDDVIQNPTLIIKMGLILIWLIPISGLLVLIALFRTIFNKELRKSVARWIVTILFLIINGGFALFVLMLASLGSAFT